MWKRIIRALAVRLGAIEKPDFVLRFVDEHPAPEQLRHGEIVVVRGKEHHKWACLRCPGGCGNRLQLSLNPSRRPRWTIESDWLERATLDPSVRQIGACGAHFWLQKGIVRWCADSTCGRAN